MWNLVPSKKAKGSPSLPKPSLLPRFTFYRLSTREENDLVRKSRISFQFHSHLQKHQQQQQSPDLLYLHSRGKLFCQLFLFYCDLSQCCAFKICCTKIRRFTVNGYTFDDSKKSNLQLKMVLGWQNCVDNGFFNLKGLKQDQNITTNE